MIVFSATTPHTIATTTPKECKSPEVSGADLESNKPTESDGATIEQQPDGSVVYTFDEPTDVMSLDVQTKSGEPVVVTLFEDGDKPSSQSVPVRILKHIMNELNLRICKLQHLT